jgi:hypothetical protein
MTKQQTRMAAAVTVTSTASLFAPVNTGGTITLLKGVLSADTDGVYQLQDGSGGTTVVTAYIAAKGNVPFDLTTNAAEFGAPGKALTAGNSLYAVGPSGGKLSCTIVTSENLF